MKCSNIAVMNVSPLVIIIDQENKAVVQNVVSRVASVVQVMLDMAVNVLNQKNVQMRIQWLNVGSVVITNISMNAAVNVSKHVTSFPKKPSLYALADVSRVASVNQVSSVKVASVFQKAFAVSIQMIENLFGLLITDLFNQINQNHQESHFDQLVVLLKNSNHAVVNVNQLVNQSIHLIQTQHESMRKDVSIVVYQDVIVLRDT